ncbi:hypothetical protein PILCRDRAFT_90676 [Piloderma croceum F 1598]|uniref:Uncharacterized protein n=1 Tax=Piloderma croceum (strain F 1598) TaxID=765440 RepID=A0A0C3FEG6_PILCF|nr:hypothetical protein PILCRDRAFT_90676 [Piloderma croceum F 1598]
MPRINLDPALEICLDFASDPFKLVRDALITTRQITNEQSILDLVSAWTQDNNIRKTAWTQQEQEDREASDKLTREVREEERQQIQKEQEAEADKREKERKKLKLNSFDQNRMISDTITPRPSGRLPEEAFGLSKSEGGFMSLKPIASFKASRNALRDIDLTWRQMTMGKNSMLHQMTATGWTQAHINSLVHFFAGLDLNTYRNRANGEQILLTYQARV